MAVAELFLGAFIKLLFEKLASGDLKRLAQSAGIYSELHKWNHKLAQIQAVLVDAGQKHIKDSSVQLWLNKLQHLAYDIDDVLDDLTTETAQRQMNGGSSASTSTSKVLKIIPNKFHDFKYGHKMSSKLDKITTKLHDLVEEKNLLGLNDNVVRSNTTIKRLEETSLVDESTIVGREADKKALLGKLLGNESCSQNVSVMSIVGMGGIGKTTLAQVLYNDKQVEDHFGLKSWVCVSDEFDVFNISKTIFKDVGGDDKKFESLNQLQVALTQKLSKKRFLIVLDDVWNEDYNKWELLQRPFVVGAPGSKIIVTTRKSTIAAVMNSSQSYPLELMSDEEALYLFAQHALGKQNFDSHLTLKLYGEGIVKKCGRLPLALKTLGRVLRTKSSDEEWEELLNSEIWNLPNEGDILPALRLSYYDLPPHLKQMFAYCCLFPKDYMFCKDELVMLWMAEGFLYQSNGSKSMESLGSDCFEELVSRSFFQHSTNYKSHYTMHDLINDLARSVAGEYFFMLGEKNAINCRNVVLEKLRHFSYIIQHYEVHSKFKALYAARRLRTFLPVLFKTDTRRCFYLSSKVLAELLPKIQFLRVLSLARCGIKVVPQSIGGLKHLRYLNFSDTDITCLPEQVGDLYNLQSLLLSRCTKLSRLPDSLIKLINLRYLNFSNTDITCLPEQVGNLYNLQSLLLSGCRKLSSLPDSLRKLINLRYLVITYTPRLKELPMGIGGLTGLQTLSKVIIGDANGFKISHLKDLQHLQGRLTIQGLHKVTNSTDAKEANLQQKKGLHDLEMEWSDIFDDSRNELIESEVLERLTPFEKLTNIMISNYMGTKFPSWLGDPTYDCLTQITLRGCRSCTCLPTLGHLPSLQKLFVESMNGLKRLGSELLGTSNGNAFPSLEVLRFHDMEGWEEWSTINDDGKDGTAVSFPCLSSIYISNCPKLGELKIEPIHSLRILGVEKCSAVALRSMIGVSSTITMLTVAGVNELTTLLDGEVLENLRAVEYLSISSCDELTYLWESEAEACKILVNLQELDVSWCKNLVRLGKKEVDLVIRMESLRSVSFYSCERLESYHCGSDSIEKIYIWNCGSMTSLNFPADDDHDLPSTFKSLEIQECKNIVEVNWLLSNFLSSLTSLYINRVPNLRLLPEGCLLHLTKLEIWNCENIESIPEKGYGFLPHLSLRYLTIASCKNIKSFPHEQLQSLASLEEMSITICPSMDKSFPCGLWPPNLSYLSIGELKKPMSEWGMQNFPNSLVHLYLVGKDSGGVVSFANSSSISNTSSSSSSSFLLPSSLTSFRIYNFKELEGVSKGMQHLTSLEELSIQNCRKLRDLPETLLPSLSCLFVFGVSRELRKKCNRKGKYWPIISQIPHHDIR